MGSKSDQRAEERAAAQAGESGRRSVLSSIRVKLVLAFAAISGLFTLAMLASETGFKALDNNLLELETVTVPISLATQKLALEVRSLEILGLNVEETADEGPLAFRRGRFFDAIAGTRRIAWGLGSAGGRFTDVLGELGVVVDKAFSIRRKEIADERALHAALALANSQATTLVEDLEAELIEAEAAGRATLGLAELRVAIYSCGNLIAQVGDGRDSTRAASLENSFRLESRRVTQLLVALEPLVRARVSRQFQPVYELTMGLEGVFRQCGKIRASSVELEDVDAQASLLINALTTVALEAANSGRQDVEAARARADERARAARVAVRGFFGAAVVLSLLIIVFYVHRGVGKRLTQLSDDLYRLSAGDHGVKIRGGGDMELAQLADAAEVFRQNAIELGEALTALEHKNASLTEFAHVASHDLKSPMRAIANLAHWVVEDCQGLLPEESQHHLQLIEERSIRMESLLEDLLRFARIGNDERLAAALSINDVIDDVVDLLGLPDTVDLRVEGGEESITTIAAPLKLTIRNLLQNSVAHHDLERQTIEVQVGPPTEGWVELTFEDDGPGIPVEHRDAAFQIFRKLTSKSAGTGMGLALVRRAVETMGGSIRIEDRSGRGVRFVVLWPATVQGGPIGGGADS